MSTATDGVADRAFVTWLAKVTREPEFAALIPWWRRQCTERALDGLGRDGVPAMDAVATVARAAADLAAVGRLLLAMQNEVSTNGDMIDGRSTRHAGPAATGKPRGRK